MLLCAVICSGWTLLTSSASQNPFCHLSSVSVTPFSATLTENPRGVTEQDSVFFAFRERFTVDPGSPRFTVAPYLTPPLFNAPLPTSPVSLFKSTFTKRSEDIDSKPFTELLKPVDATLAKILRDGTADDKSATFSPAPATNRLSHQILLQGMQRPTRVLAHGSRPTDHVSRSPRRLEGHPRRQYNPLFARRGGIRHGHCRSENPRF
jgi:hypothetical protein